MSLDMRTMLKEMDDSQLQNLKQSALNEDKDTFLRSVSYLKDKYKTKNVLLKELENIVLAFDEEDKPKLEKLVTEFIDKYSASHIPWTSNLGRESSYRPAELAAGDQVTVRLRNDEVVQGTAYSFNWNSTNNSAYDIVEYKKIT